MSKSQAYFERAQNILPGGVNSPVRACKSVGCDPVFIARAAGGRMWTVDGEELVDFVMSWGPMLLGHAHPEVEAAAMAALKNGASFGAPCPAEVELGEKIREIMPGMEMLRMVSSGTEATMSAVRLARGCTGRAHVLKFDGCYHGHSDGFLVSAGSGLATFSIPGTPGVPEAIAGLTLLAPYNDLAAVEAQFQAHPEDIACVIVEPVAGNVGLIEPAPGFLEGLRALCTKYGALLIFDEVISGFRAALGGAQQRYGVSPDLTTLGKIIGGGFPVGCYGGKREIMAHIAPSGNVYQAGTLSGNPVAMAAGLATLGALSRCDYAALERRTADFAGELADILRAKGQNIVLNQAASLFTLFFTNTPVTDYATAKTQDSAAYAGFYRQMRAAGVNLAPSGYECGFTSFAHTQEDFDRALAAARAVRF
jgi:glutamate-1-semialdehyde 2,1-aminomutase